MWATPEPVTVAGDDRESLGIKVILYAEPLSRPVQIVQSRHCVQTLARYRFGITFNFPVFPQYRASSMMQIVLGTVEIDTYSHTRMES